METIKKTAFAIFAVIAIATTVWYAVMASEGNISWGVNGFIGYSVMTTGFIELLNVMFHKAMTYKD